jgi:hypothetical protein
MSNARINLFWLIIFTLTLPLAVVMSTHLARKSFERVKLGGQVVTVKGYAEKPIVSDFGQWSAEIVERHADRTTAYRQLEESRAKTLAYLENKGVPASQVALDPVTIRTLHARDQRGNLLNEIELYVVSQRLGVSSNDVGRVATIARDASILIRDNVELVADSPVYICTKLEDYKIEMLAAATENARLRAQQLIAGSQSKLGSLKTASQGVFQITPAYSTEVSGYGVNDTTSIEKSIKAVVTVEYNIIP